MTKDREQELTKLDKKRNRREKKANRYTKRKYRKEKKRVRLQNRANNDASFYRKIIRFTLIVVSICLCIVIFMILSHMYRLYNNTEEWKKSSPIKISSIPTDVLYMNDKKRQQYLKYFQLYDDIWDSNQNNFKKNINQDKIDQFDQSYQNINDPMKKVKHSHQYLNSMWDVKKNYEQLIDKDNKVKKDVTPNQIRSFIIKQSDTLMNDLLKPGDHKFSEKMRTNMIHLSSDLTKVDKMMSVMDSQYKIDKKNKSIFILGNMLPKNKINSKDYIKNMYYDWSYITSQVDSIMDDADPIFNKNQKLLNEYHAYLSDNKDESDFKSFKDEYYKKKKDLNSQIIDMPDLKGKSLDEAKDWANEHNVKLNIEYEESDDESNHTVLDQTPNKKNYDKMLTSAELDLTVSEKPKEKQKVKDDNKEDQNNDNEDKSINNDNKEDRNNDNDNHYQQSNRPQRHSQSSSKQNHQTQHQASNEQENQERDRDQHRNQQQDDDNQSQSSSNSQENEQDNNDIDDETDQDDE